MSARATSATSASNSIAASSPGCAPARATGSPRFPSPELIEHGEAELRQWIVLLGAVGARKPEFLVYEPLFRSIMGMGVGWWQLE